MINKKGNFFESEIVKIVIAVLALFLLILLAAKLYGIFTLRTDIEQAKVTLDKLTVEINALGVDEEKVLFITSPSEWYIASYDFGEDSPKECFGKHCLCVCQDIDDCAVKSICRIFEQKIEAIGIKKTRLRDTGNFIKIEGPFNLIIRNEKDLVSLEKIMVGKDADIFNNFLRSKFEFMEKENVEIREQIKIFYNSNLIPYKRDNSQEKKELVENIQEYFKDYEYPINFYLLSGNFASGMNLDTSSILKVEVGKNNPISDDEELPEWPELVIDNPDGKYIKGFIGVFSLRK